MTIASRACADVARHSAAWRYTLPRLTAENDRRLRQLDGQPITLFANPCLFRFTLLLRPSVAATSEVRLVE